MTGQTDDALMLMERAVASRDPLELALAGFLSAYKGRTFDKQRRVIKHYVDWCLQNDLPPLQAKRPHIELFVRRGETQPWSESYICQHFIGVQSFYKTCVRDDLLLRNPCRVRGRASRQRGRSAADVPLAAGVRRLPRCITQGRTGRACRRRADGPVRPSGRRDVQPAGRVTEPGRRLRQPHDHRQGRQARRHPAPGAGHARRPRRRRGPHEWAPVAQPSPGTR